MKRLPGARYWHIPLLYLVATLMLAAIFALHDQPDFLGPYLLLLGELLAGILVLRFNEKGKKFLILRWSLSPFVEHLSSW